MYLTIDNNYSSTTFSARHRWWRQFAKTYKSPRNAAIEARQTARKAKEVNEKAVKNVTNIVNEQTPATDIIKQA